MRTFFTLFLLVCSVIPASLANIFAYPVSKKLRLKISNYIEYVLAPRVFAILKCYNNFNYWAYKESKENLPENFILVANHQSLIDIPAFFKFFHERPVRFVAKDVLERHVPLVSEMLRSQKHCMIPRKAKPMDAMKVIEKFGKRIVVDKEVPLIFPEGTRTKDGNVGKFYSAGLRKLVDSTNLPIVVCAMDGGIHLRDLKTMVISMDQGCYRVKALKVYDPPKSKEAFAAILDESRELIQKQLDEWRTLPSYVK